MKISAQQKIELLEKVRIIGRLSERFTLPKINTFITNNFLSIYYIDSNGEQKSSKMYYEGILKIIDGIILVLEKNPKLSEIDICLSMISECENFGNVWAKKSKALLSECSCDDSKRIDILETILRKGAMLRNGINHNGNTIYDSSELFSIIKHVYNYDKETIQNILTDFYKEKQISIYENKLGLTDFIGIESRILEYTKSKSSFIFPLNCIEKETLNESQKNAVEILADNDDKINLLLGSAGVGKSYVIAKIIEACIDMELVVCVATPTHAAAKVLAQSLEDAGTNPGCLAFKRVITVDAAKFASKKNVDKIDLLICDESSMMSTKHFDLINLINPEKVLLVGDPKQLPPIEAGSPFHDLVNSNVTKAYLTQQMRNKNEEVKEIVNDVDKNEVLNFTKVFPFSDKKKLPQEINEKVLNQFKNYIISHKDDVWLAEQNNLVDWLNIVLLNIKHNSEKLDENILNLIKTYYINDYSAPKLNFSECVGEIVYWDSQKFKVKANENYSIVRGSIGTILEKGLIEIEGVKTKDVSGKPTQKFVMRLIDFPFYGESLRLMFARTIHKSQGASFDKVTYLVKDSSYIKSKDFKLNIKKDLAYVACSRAINSLNVVCFIHDISTYISPKTLRKTLLNSFL